MSKTDTQLLDPNKILDRIKHQLKFRYDKELADFLGITPTALSNQRALRSGVDYEAIIVTCQGINLNWIFFGDETVHPPFSSLEPIATGVLAANADSIVAKLREAISIIESHNKGRSQQ